MTQSRRRKPKGQEPDASSLVCVDAERQCLAGLLDIIDRDTEAARAIAERVGTAPWRADHTADLFRAIVVVLQSCNDPTRVDVGNAIRRQAEATGVDPNEDSVRRLFFDMADATTASVPTARRYAEQAADEILKLHKQRQAIHLGRELAEAGQRGDDLSVMYERLGAMLAPTDQRVADGVITFDQCVDEYLNAQDDAVIRTSFQLFDDATDGGLPVGELTGLCAPPGAGKSALALQLVIGAMIGDPSLRALWCLGEMTPRILVRRAACVGTAIMNGGVLTMRDAKRRTGEAREVAEDMKKLLGGGRFSVLKPALTVERIEAAIRTTKSKVVVLDYLQLMTGAGVDRIGEMEATVAQLTALANTTETAIVVVSSMSKAAIGGGAKVGTIGKGTGQIDYAMSFVFLGEPDEAARQSGATTFDVTWKCVKSRNEARHDFTARFDGARQFYSRAVDQIEEFASFGINGVQS
jgi:replicative DNA helicase